MTEPYPAIQAEPGNPLVPVRFLKAAMPYGQDEIAGFPETQSRRLIEAGIARYLDPEPETKPPARGKADANHG